MIYLYIQDGRLCIGTGIGTGTLYRERFIGHGRTRVHIYTALKQALVHSFSY